MIDPDDSVLRVHSNVCWNYRITRVPRRMGPNALFRVLNGPVAGYQVPVAVQVKQAESLRPGSQSGRVVSEETVDRTATVLSGQRDSHVAVAVEKDVFQVVFVRAVEFPDYRLDLSVGVKQHGARATVVIKGYGAQRPIGQKSTVRFTRFGDFSGQTHGRRGTQQNFPVEQDIKYGDLEFPRALDLIRYGHVHGAARGGSHFELVKLNRRLGLDIRIFLPVLHFDVDAVRAGFYRFRSPLGETEDEPDVRPVKLRLGRVGEWRLEGFVGIAGDVKIIGRCDLRPLIDDSDGFP